MLRVLFVAERGVNKCAAQTITFTQLFSGKLTNQS